MDTEDLNNKLTSLEEKIDFIALSVKDMSFMLKQMHDDFAKSRDATQSMMDSILGSDIMDSFSSEDNSGMAGVDQDMVRNAAETIGGLTSSIKELKARLEGVNSKFK